MKDQDLDHLLYPALLIGCALVAAGVLIYVRWFSHIPVAGCWVYEELHLYCPGCGCTRAFAALLQGDVLRSLRYNPGVAYFALGTVVYLLTQTVQRLTGWRCGVRFRPIYLHLGFGILVGNALVWNLLWHVWRIQM